MILIASIAAGVGFWSHSCLQAARDASNRHKFKQARRDVDRYLALWPGSYRAHLLAARICRAQGDYATAREHLSACMKAEGETEEINVEWVLLGAETGWFPRVERQMRAWVDGGHAQSTLIMESLVASLVAEGRYQAAGNYLTRWLQAEPDNAVAYFWKGMAHEKSGDPEQARAGYSRCVELEPDRVEARERLAQICLLGSDFVAARSHLKALELAAPDRPSVWLLLGMGKMHEGRLEHADRFFVRVLEANPNNAAALYQRGVVAKERGLLTEAERQLRRAVALAPDLNAARYALYQCLLGQQRPREAAAELAAFKASMRRSERLVELMAEIEKRPVDCTLLVETSELLVDSQPALARQFLKRVLIIQPGHEKAQKLLARASSPGI